MAINYIVGTCGNCGGPVKMPYVWTSLAPRPMACADCDAEPKPYYGPTLEMYPAPHEPGKKSAAL